MCWFREQAMPSCDHREHDVFFDSKDCLSSEESDVAEEEAVSGDSVCEFLANEPFMELDQLSNGVHRIMEHSGAESSSLGLSEKEEDVACCRSEASTEANTLVEECDVLRVNDKQVKTWWKRLSFKTKGRRPKSSKPDLETSKSRFGRTEVKHNSKRVKELTALFTGQELQAHKGLIRTMKFSPDGKYLASGGEDGVVRIWQVKSTNACHRDFDFSNEPSSYSNLSSSLVVIPDKVFCLEEKPLQELHGHISDVLELAWSGSNSLLSSSKDQTVRLWQMGCDECLHVFHHNNYVTCIQFDPVDENLFITGSIDGIVRIWSIPEKRVVDWTDASFIITAICYQPDGKGFVVGSIEGTCRFYDASGSEIQLDTQINVSGRKRTSSRVTGIQFSLDESRRVMIVSDDSKIRVFEKAEVACKYKGCVKSGSQVSATFTPTGKHVVSVGEDSRVYIWKHDGSSVSSSKRKRGSVRSCEHFLSEGASLAVPWLGTGSRSPGGGGLQEGTRARDAERFSLGNWFDGPCRGSATWPEEELPSWDGSGRYLMGHKALPETWGLVMVTAGWDGKIRTFHNYGLPVRL